MLAISRDGASATDPTLPVILVVEDHADTRAMYAEFLGLRYAVDEAGDANAAIERARARRPNLVITDVSLPGTDGFALIQRLRLDLGLRDVPMICLSGYGGHDHEERARQVGCQRVLQKPCLPDDLMRHVETLLRETGRQPGR